MFRCSGIGIGVIVVLLSLLSSSCARMDSSPDDETVAAIHATARISPRNKTIKSIVIEANTNATAAPRGDDKSSTLSAPHAPSNKTIQYKISTAGETATNKTIRYTIANKTNDEEPNMEDGWFAQIFFAWGWSMAMMIIGPVVFVIIIATLCLYRKIILTWIRMRYHVLADDDNTGGADDNAELEMAELRGYP